MLYQWFLHQIELLAAHIADITDSLGWGPFYTEEKPGIGSRPTDVELVAISYAARSTRLGRIAPTGLSRRLLVYRALSGRFESPRSFSDTVDQHYEKCMAIASELASYSLDGANSEITGEIGRKLPFSRYSIDASPGQIPIYITRNEFDPDNGMQGRGVVLETDWEIVESDSWKQRYKSAKPEMQQAAKNARSKLENNVKHSGFEWKPCQPENQWYFRLNQEFRGIALIDNRSERLTLLDFGEHDSPKDFGCYQ